MSLRRRRTALKPPPVREGFDEFLEPEGCSGFWGLGAGCWRTDSPQRTQRAQRGGG